MANLIVSHTLKQKHELKPALRVKLGAKLKMAQLLETSEEDFAKKVRELQTNPIFHKLLIWGRRKTKTFPMVQQFKNSLPPGRKRNLNSIIAQLRWINGRRNIIYSILQSLLKKQERFLVSGRQENLKSLTQIHG